MLAQSEQVVDENQRLELLRLHQMELEMMRDDFNAVATTAALLAGFAFTGCADIDVPDGMHPAVKRIYYIAISLCMCLMVYCVVVSTACVVMGPDMSINGARRGSSSLEVACVVTRATGGMRVARRPIFGTFMLGLVTMLFATMLVTSAKLGFEDPNDEVTAAFVIMIFSLGLIAVLITVFGLNRLFDSSPHALYKSRRRYPGMACGMCGHTQRDGMCTTSQRFWLPIKIPCQAGGICQVPWAKSMFQCYQCMGQRLNHIKGGRRESPRGFQSGPRSEPHLGSGPTSSHGADDGSVGCCGGGATKQRGPGSGGPHVPYASSGQRAGGSGDMAARSPPGAGDGGHLDGDWFVVDSAQPDAWRRGGQAPVNSPTGPSSYPADPEAPQNDSLTGGPGRDSWVMVDRLPFAGRRNDPIVSHHAQLQR